MYLFLFVKESVDTKVVHTDGKMVERLGLKFRWLVNIWQLPATAAYSLLPLL